MLILSVSFNELFLPIMWAVIAILAVIVEASTVQLVSVWFAVSACVACVLAAFKVSLPIQIIVFSSLTIVLFILSVFVFKKMLKKREKNNETPDEIVNEIAVVTKEIKPGMIGEVKTRYDFFNALGINSDDEFIVGEKVQVVQTSGNKLIIKKLEN